MPDPVNLLKGLYPIEVEVGFSTEDKGVEVLSKEEKEIVKEVGEKRQGEFASGRACAHDAMKKLEVEGPILMGEKREPLWPEGIMGSISHANGLTAAVVAKPESKKESVGLDIEVVGRMKPELWEKSFVEDELEWIHTLGDEAHALTTVMFGAKEAFYKAQFPISKTWLGFMDAEVNLDEDMGNFKIKLLKDIPKVGKIGSVYDGRFAFYQHYTFCGLWLKV